MIPVAELLRDLVRLPSVNPMGRAANADICLEHRVKESCIEIVFRLTVADASLPSAP